MTAPSSRPSDRYGDRSPPRVLRLAAVAIGVALVVAAVIFISRALDARIDASVLSYDQPAGGTMAATIEVVRRPEIVVTCDVVALDLRQIIVGQLELVVPASSERRAVLPVEIPLQGEGVAVSVRGCTPAVGR